MPTKVSDFEQDAWDLGSEMFSDLRKHIVGKQNTLVIAALASMLYRVVDHNGERDIREGRITLDDDTTDFTDLCCKVGTIVAGKGMRAVPEDYNVLTLVGALTAMLTRVMAEDDVLRRSRR